jgi:hypothetical protein
VRLALAFAAAGLRVTLDEDLAFREDLAFTEDFEEDFERALVLDLDFDAARAMQNSLRRRKEASTSDT